MTPSFTDFFKSFYYSKTFLPPVDLSFKGTRKHLLETAGGGEMANIMAIAKEIIDPIVQSIFSEPLTYDPKSVKVKNEYLKAKGFKLLNQKSGQEHYSVVEHPKLKGWVIKAGATHTPKGLFDRSAANDRHERAYYSEEGNLLRIAMAERIRAVAKASGIDVVVPMKKLFEYEQPNGTKITNRYCIFSEKIDILSEKETLERVKNMDEAEQRKLAQDLSTIIQKSGLVDNGFHNIRLTPDGKLAFIDTEPQDLLIAQEPGFWKQLFPSMRTSVEQCGRIGLCHLLQRTSAQNLPYVVPVEHQTAAPGLEHFYGQILQDYAKTLHPELSASKIALSIVSLGLLPLFVLIASIINSISAHFLFQEIIQSENTLHYLKSDLFRATSATGNGECWDEYIDDKNYKAMVEQENDRLKGQFHALTAAVPFKAPPGPKPKPQKVIPVVDIKGEFLRRIKKAEEEEKALQDANNNANAATSAKEPLTTATSSIQASATPHLSTSTQQNPLLNTNRIEDLGLPKRTNRTVTFTFDNPTNPIASQITLGFNTLGSNPVDSTIAQSATAVMTDIFKRCAAKLQEKYQDAHASLMASKQFTVSFELPEEEKKFRINIIYDNEIKIDLPLSEATSKLLKESLMTVTS